MLDIVTVKAGDIFVNKCNEVCMIARMACVCMHVYL